MKQIKLYQFIITTLLLLSIFSFSTTTLIDESSELYYETLLDDNGESDDKQEEEGEKKLFVLSQLVSCGFYVIAHKTTLLQELLPNFKEFTTPFRPPIVS